MVEMQLAWPAAHCGPVLGAGGRRDRAGAAGDVAAERTEGLLADGESAAAALNGGYQVGAGLSPVAIAVALCCAPSARPRRSARPPSGAAAWPTASLMKQ